jgi:hypothetical protein
VTRAEAIEIARRCAKTKPQSYYAEPFQPHEWVIDAIIDAASRVHLQTPAVDLAEARKRVAKVIDDATDFWSREVDGDDATLDRIVQAAIGATS